MGTNLAVSTTPDDPAGAPASLGGFSADTGATLLFASSAAGVAVPAFNGRELRRVLVLSALLHVGFALVAFSGGRETRAAHRLSRVELELARPPAPVRPATRAIVPPPPPKLAKPERKQVPVPSPAAPVETPTPTPTEAPSDTGSSAAAAEDGELHAGAGGLGTAAPTPAPPPPVVRAEPVVQAREGANYLKNPRPPYPRRAKHEGWEGTTVLRVVVQPSGKPGAIKIHQSSGHDVLDQAAAETVAAWTFVPATQGGQPMAGSVTVPIVFRLQ